MCQACFRYVLNLNISIKACILDKYFHNKLLKQEGFIFLSKTHNISYLASKVGLFEQLSEKQKDFLDELEPLNIEARYPGNKDALMKKLDNAYSTEIYIKTKGLYQWIKKRLS